MSTEPQRTCPSCGNEFSGAMEFCPVCMLRKALAEGGESGESSASEDTVKTALEQAKQRFEHYELTKGADGTPVEEGNEPEWNRLRPELLRFECADLRVIESCHKICSAFSGFRFAYGLRDILLIALKNVLQCASIIGSASIPEQLNRHRRNRQQ
jgi:hypothetical protein